MKRQTVDASTRGRTMAQFLPLYLLSSNPSTQKQSVVFEIVFSLCFATISVALDTWEHCAHTLINTMDAPSQYTALDCLRDLWLQWAEVCSRGCDTVLYASMRLKGDHMLILRSIILFWVTARTGIHARASNDRHVFSGWLRRVFSIQLGPLQAWLKAQVMQMCDMDTVWCQQWCAQTFWRAGAKRRAL